MPPARAPNCYNLNSMPQFRGRNLNHESIATAAVNTDERQSPSPSHSAHKQAPPYVKLDPRERLEDSFCTYLERKEERNRLVENQKEDTNDILVFGALLSATVATLVGASIQGLKPDPRDKWAYYLAKTLQLLAEEDESRTPVPPPPFSDPTHFTPSIYVVLVNSLWFLSLGISLTSILLASVPRRWAHIYSDSLSNSLRRGRRPRTVTRRHHAMGGDPRVLIDGRHDDDDLQPLPWLIVALPTMLRISLYLFFAGFGVLVFSLTLNLGIGQALLLTASSLVCPILCFHHP